MNGEPLVALLQNAAMLLAMVSVYDLATRGRRVEGHFWRQAFVGMVLGALGIALILASYRLETGIVFDTRSVLLVTCGLFFGPVPTVVAMAMTIVFRLAQGGAAAMVGSLVIATTGGLGILWRRVRRRPLADIRWPELYGLGVLAHLAMLAIMFLLPRDAALRVVAGIGLPVMLIYPVATVVLGLLLANRLKQDRSAAELAESRERYRSMFENNHAVMLVVDPRTGAVLDANPAACRFYGWERREMLERSILEINTLSADEIRSEMDRAHALGRYHFLFKHRLADGSIRDVEVFSGPIVVDGREVLFSIIHDISERRRAEMERERLLAESREARRTLQKALEDRQQAEREKAGIEDQLRQAQKMDSVGRLAGGVAHDFNNSLQVILGFSEQLLAMPDLPATMRADLGEIRGAATRSATLTSQLLAFARRQTIAPRVMDLNDAIAGMLKMLRRLLGEDIDLVWAPGAALGPVCMDPSQVDQILANLTVNARDAIGGVGKLTIETQNAVLDEAYCATHADALPGDYVMLAVSDDGCGMDRGTLERVFDPFFTTKDVGKGTGLGLATVYGIVKQNRGSISVSSEPGRGTTFKLYLPRCAGEAARPEPEAAPPSLRGGRETILLVEDEASVCAITRAGLESLGYVVMAVESPELALQVSEAHRGEIDLLLTDVVMPAMNGRDMADRILRQRPGLPCIYMSGYMADVVTDHGIPGDVDFISKPFPIQALALKVREVLDRSRSAP